MPSALLFIYIFIYLLFYSYLLFIFFRSLVPPAAQPDWPELTSGRESGQSAHWSLTGFSSVSRTNQLLIGLIRTNYLLLGHFYSHSFSLVRSTVTASHWLFWYFRRGLSSPAPSPSPMRSSLSWMSSGITSRYSQVLSSISLILHFRKRSPSWSGSQAWERRPRWDSLSLNHFDFVIWWHLITSDDIWWYLMTSDDFL